MFAKLVHRLKADLVPRNHSRTYKAALINASANGYSLVPSIDAYSMSDLNRVIALRHDVDLNDIKSNTSFFEIEREIGARATYYFRLNTVRSHLPLIKKLIDHGFEVGYHFEEAADFGKSRNIKSTKILTTYRAEIQNRFKANLKWFESITNVKVASVCSHGDWYNRRLGFTNHVYIDEPLLSELGIQFEAYQDKFFNRFDTYVSDTGGANSIWKNDVSLDAAIDLGKNSIYMLTHERTFFLDLKSTWESNRIVFGEQIKYKLS
ncbi:hypothetical protein EBR57_01600 [bacterium]|nr:hypothetical protein [bacterium]